LAAPRRHSDPKAFGDDISARRATVVEANKTAKPIVGVEPGRDSLSIFGITPIMRDGKSLAVADIGANLGKEFVDSAKQRLGVDLAVHWFDGKSFGKLSSTFGDAVVATREELKNAFDGGTLRRDATLNGHPAALYLGQIKNYAGQPIAVIEVIKDTTDYEAAATSSQRNLMLGGAVILAGAVLLAFLLGRGLSRPLTAITAVMNRLSSGDTDVTIPGGDRKDELGTMAKAVDVFRRHDRGPHAARSAGGHETAGPARKESVAAPNGRPLRSRCQNRGRRRREGDPGHAARRGRDHTKRQRHLGAGRGRGGRIRRGIGQRRHGRRRHRGTCLFGCGNRPAGHPFQRRRR
jgi:HAMP domain-containing protein